MLTGILYSIFYDKLTELIFCQRGLQGFSYHLGDENGCRYVWNSNKI